MLQTIIKDIERAYGSSGQANYSFVSKRANAGLYNDLVKDVAGFAELVETTDLNDDVSRALHIRKVDAEVGLRLSFVGDYACAHTADGKVLTENDLKRSELGNNIIEVTKKAGIAILPEELLRQIVRVANKDLNVYTALFSDDELI